MRSQPPSSLEQFVMGDHNAPVTASVLIQARLAGFAYRVLPENHALRQSLREPRRNLEIHHQLVKHQLQPLIRAWGDAGIKVMFIKGFWLAEFIYERPGDRGYGDIDILISENQAQQAIQIAKSVGWGAVFNRQTSGNPHSHEEAHIVSSNGQIRIDLHRFALQSIQTWGQYHPNRLTQTFWSSAIQYDWEGITVWLPRPLDGLIINLLNRARGDLWKRRISDLPDAIAVIKYSSISREVFLARTAALNVKNTTIAILRTCDPWNNHIRIAPPSLLNRIGLYVKTAREIGIFELEEVQFLFDRALNAVSGLPTMLSIVVQVKRELKRKSDLHQIFQTLEQHYSAKTVISDTELIRLKRSTHLALMILGPRQDACVPRSLALYLALHQRNIKVQFVSGIRRVQGKLVGHAWLEWQGRPLEGFGDHDAPETFKENFRYPIKTNP
jgi:hypothetical protein